jgi:signal transduction histidine kinase
MLADLSDKIGVIQASSYVSFVCQKFPDATLIEYSDWSSLVDAVIRGDVMAAYRDELEIKKIILTRPQVALQMQMMALGDTKDQIAIAVTNYGVELPTEQQQRIFDKFYRIPHSDPWKQGRTGLGLTLVDGLMQHSGGQITVNSHNNHVTFTLLFPQFIAN